MNERYANWKFTPDEEDKIKSSVLGSLANLFKPSPEIEVRMEASEEDAKKARQKKRDADELRKLLGN